QLYVDDMLRYQIPGSKLDTSLPIDPGRHHVIVQSWDTAGGIHKSGINITAQSQAVVVTSPAPNAVVRSPVPIHASAGGNSQVRTMRIYVDGVSEYQASGNTVSKSLPMSTGRHTVTVQATDEAGGIVKTALPVNVAKPSVTIVKPSNGQGTYSPVEVWGVAQDQTRFMPFRCTLTMLCIMR